MHDGKGRLTGRRVLVVEDDPIIALHIKQILEREGATVVGPAHTVSAALALAERVVVDCAVLDLRLEQDDAVPVAQVLEKRGIPFIFQTSDKGKVPQGYRAAALEKPISESQLVHALARATAAKAEPAEDRRATMVPSDGTNALEIRIRQQELLAELGVQALQRMPVIALLQRAAEVAAEGLQAEFSKVLEYLPAQQRLLLKAGVGWEPELIGVATVGADVESAAGFALKTGRPVIANQLELEQRFRTPELLATHGVRRAMNVILQGDGAPYGVLEVDSRSPGDFSEKDISFLQGAANILGMAIERERYDEQLRAALDYQTVLTGEINHRIKNSLQLVASILQLQARANEENETLGELLGEAVLRIRAIARVHERLNQGRDISRVNLTEYILDVCSDMAEYVSNAKVSCDGHKALWTSADRAIRVALVVGELVTNASKHAFRDASGGTIEVHSELDDSGGAIVTVTDNGCGVPPAFRFEKSRSLGSRIILSLVEQLGGRLELPPVQRGTRVVLHAPLIPTAN